MNRFLRNMLKPLAYGIAILFCSLPSLSQAFAGKEQDRIAFQSVVKPFFTRHCVKCHGEEKQRGKIALHNLDPTKRAKSDLDLWDKIIEVLAFSEMPPAHEPQPDRSKSRQIMAWIKGQLASAGRESDIDHKLLHPDFANLISHEKLFNGSIKGPAFSPPRLWRLHPMAYDAFLQSFSRNLSKWAGPLSEPFVVGDGKGIPSNYAALASADSATLGQLMLNCRKIAELQTVGFKVLQKDRRSKKMVERIYRQSPAAFDAILNSNGKVAERLLQAAVTEEFDLVLNRKPSSTELTAFTKLLKETIRIGGKGPGLRTMAMAILLRPEAIYRMELGVGKADKHGRRMLSSYELAHAIAYALTDTPPQQLLLGPPRGRGRSKRPTEPALMDLAKNGKLQSREDVQAAVERIWANDLIEKPRILRFFQEFFGYHTAGSVFKGDRAPRFFSPRHIIRDADQLVLHILKQDKDVLKELLTTERFFFQWPGSKAEYEKRIAGFREKMEKKNKRKSAEYRYFVERTDKTGKKPIPQANPGWRKLALLLNIDPMKWDYPLEQPFLMPKGQRCGILTHPAWLIAWSGNFENDPIRRGKWIREHLLADSVPEVPITVDASVPQDPTKTLRQRLVKTREHYCWQCHQKTDPLGLPFEAYTDFGRYRDREGLGLTRMLQKTKKTAPLATSGEIIDSGDPALDGKVKDVHDLMHRLAKSDRARQSFVRHAFRYWMGRNEMLSDSPTLIRADRAYVDSHGSFKALVVALLTSDSFLYRK